MATAEQIRGNWNTIVRFVQDAHPEISDDDVRHLDENVDRLIEVVHQKTGESHQQVQGFLDECCRAAENMPGQKPESQESREDISARATEWANEATERAKEGYQYASETASRGYDRSVQTVSSHPVSSVMTAWGLGLLTGLAIGWNLAESRMQSRRRNWW